MHDITRILIVEDNQIDSRLTTYALQKLPHWPIEIQVVNDGEKAIQVLSTNHVPDLVILDLNLPKVDGTEVLHFIRSQTHLHNLLVFIFSSSPADATHYKMSSQKLHADGYFEKPSEVGTFSSIAQQFQEHYQQAQLARNSATA